MHARPTKPVRRTTPDLRQPGQRTRRTPRRDQNPIDRLRSHVLSPGRRHIRNRDRRMRPATSPAIPPQPLARRTNLAPPSILHRHRTRQRRTQPPGPHQLQGQKSGKQATPLHLVPKAGLPLCTRRDPSCRAGPRAGLLPLTKQRDRSRSQDPSLNLGPPSLRSVPNLHPDPRPSPGQTRRPILLHSMKVRRTRATRSRIQPRNNRPETTASFWSLTEPGVSSAPGSFIFV